MKTIIITGSDRNYFNYLNLLCSSLKNKNIFLECDLGIFDAGLTEDQKKKVLKYTDKIVEPDWNFEKNFEAKNWKKLLNVRPFLKNYFPGYDVYIWMDADMISLSNKFVRSIHQVFENTDKEICVCNEIDNSYINKEKDKSFKKIIGKFYKINGWVYKNNYKYLGSKIADKLLGKPLINAGFFALRAESLIWDVWKEIYKKIVENNNDEYCLSMDQSSLNSVLYNYLEKVNFFDTKFNWLNKNSLPIIKNKKFCKPLYPYEEIEIMHNTSFDIEKLHLFYNFDAKENINSSLNKLFNELYI